MKRLFFSSVCLILICQSGISQSAPNQMNSAVATPTSGKAAQLASVPVNIFTGVPNVSVPIYSYANPANGLSLDISLSYYAGGIRVAEQPTTMGLGWYLNAGGVITRAVRGMPDDLPTNGSLHSSAIPADYRTDGRRYYLDSVDSQLDIFQFSFAGRAGKFYIGKNQQVVQVPLSKLKIVPTFGYGGSTDRLISFKIITENGVKYEFNHGDVEKATISDGFPGSLISGYKGVYYYSSWNLSRIISPFNTDTIKIQYNSRNITGSYPFPWSTFVDGAGVRGTTFNPRASITSEINNIASIDFPDKTKVTFVYTDKYKYFSNDMALSKIKIADTKFRYGYLLEYQNTVSPTDNTPCRLLLKSVTPYTSTEKQEGFTFNYNGPYFPVAGGGGDTLGNKMDHWGFYNGAYNPGDPIPQVNGYSWGANRDPDFDYAIANSLNSFRSPGGGIIAYEYELNDHYPYIKDPEQLSITANTSSQNAIILSQVFNNLQQIVFTLDYSVSREGAAPISAGGNLTCNIKSSDGTILYKSINLSLYDLFYQGMYIWAFNLPNGNYRLETQLAAGTTLTASLPIAVTWENKLEDSSKTFESSGGLRIKKVTRMTSDSIVGSAEEYKYIKEDGKSSGFFGGVPKYDYPYRKKVNYGGTTITNFTVVSSEPVSTMSFEQGTSIGYSRVEIIKGTSTLNNGRTVYEFTDLRDLNVNSATPAFPYIPVDTRDWGTGMPKRVSIYDSSGNLVKRTVNTIGYDTIAYENSNFKSIRIGHSGTIYNGDPYYIPTPKVYLHVGRDYYPKSGRAYVVSTSDTLYQSDGSINASTKSFTYDTCYNIAKITSGYDRTRGLSVEQRIYYPYNYTVGGVIGKLKDSSLLNTVIATENWIVGDASPRIISAEIKTFKQISSGQVKPDTVFALESNKPVPQATITVFTPTKVNRNYTYFKPQIRNLNYDNKGNVIERVSLKTGQSSSIILDYGQRYVVAEVSNAANSDIAYTSFESDDAGYWAIGSTARDSSDALTGRKSYNLSSGNLSRSGLSSSKTYLVSIWLKSGASASINGIAVSGPIASQVGWNLYQKSLNGVTSVTVSGSGLIDEIRLYPVHANMISSTYEPTIGISSMSDANSTVVHNEYDGLNRLKVVRDKDKNILKRYDYSDTVMSISMSPAWEFDAVECLTSGNGAYDSIYVDTNPFSDTYGGTLEVPRSNSPSCCTAPLYKMVNGICEEAIRVNLSTTWVKIYYDDPPELVWKWRCIWRYEWSDGTAASSNYTEYNDDPCPL